MQLTLRGNTNFNLSSCQVAKFISRLYIITYWILDECERSVRHPSLRQ